MLDIEQPNQEEIHVFVKGQSLRFAINEFALITGLNCIGNIDDFKYEDSSMSRLMKRYFPQSTNGVSKEALCSYANIVPTVDEFEKLDLACKSFTSDHHGTTSTNTAVNETDKPIAIADAKASETPSICKQGEQHEKDVGIEMQSDIVIEEIQPLESVIPSGEQDLILTINKPPPTTLAEYEISDTVILSVFSTPKKNVSADKKVPALRSKKPLKIYRSPFLTHFGSSSKEKKKLASKERKKYPFKGYQINRDSPTLEMEIFEEWINDGLYRLHTKKYTTEYYFFKVYIDKAYVNYYNSDVAKDLATQDASARTDEVADMEKSLINTIKGLRMCVGHPWHMVHDVFVPINFDDAFHWVLVVIALMDRCIRVDYGNYFLECRDYGVFVAVYTDYLSEGLRISCSGIDDQYHCLRYASILSKYGSEKAENGYFSENEDPPRPRSKFALKETDRVLHIK
ncbi:hypothetical protein FXO37_19927 [Capsicum annuum]|nr:hypothetical protein FXO37_19927 [Capsicum annuum]